MADAKQGKTPSEDLCNGSSQSRVVLAKPRLGGFGSSLASTSNKTSSSVGSVLRPPQLKPAVNQFLNASGNKNDTESKNEKDTDKSKENSEETEVPKFVPLASTNATPRTSNQVPAPAQPTTSTTSASIGFVFGQNLSERVVMNENVNNGDSTMSDHNSSNGTTELLFTSAAASVKENQEEVSTGESSGASGLAAAAAEYERSHARPPPPTTNYSLTGEEDEINVLQISCRLFAWESGSWRERGRGVLRVNEWEGGSRVVARIAGSLRVVLNTKLWPDMVVERAGTKSLRITAADAQQQVKLFLIMGAPQDIAHLHRALITRVAASKRTTSTCSQNAPSQQAAERLEAASNDNESTDKSDDATSNKHDDSRIEASRHKTEECESNVDGMQPDTENNTLKRKEPVGDESSPKRQCAEIVRE